MIPPRRITLTLTTVTLVLATNIYGATAHADDDPLDPRAPKLPPRPP